MTWNFFSHKYLLLLPNESATKGIPHVRILLKDMFILTKNACSPFLLKKGKKNFFVPLQFGGGGVDDGELLNNALG